MKKYTKHLLTAAGISLLVCSAAHAETAETGADPALQLTMRQTAQKTPEQQLVEQPIREIARTPQEMPAAIQTPKAAPEHMLVEQPGQSPQGTAPLSAEQPPAQTMQKATPSALSYLYESKVYGYRMMCPKAPVGVIPASMLYEGRKGEVLIFDNEEYNIKNAWVVLVDAFSDDALPDLNTIDREQAETLLKGIMGSNGYEGIMLVNLTEYNKAIFAMTAKEIEIDEDGDGTVDATAKADTQMAVLFFRGAAGERYGLELIDNPDLRAASVAAFIAGARTLTAVQK